MIGIGSIYLSAIIGCCALYFSIIGPFLSFTEILSGLIFLAIMVPITIAYNNRELSTITTKELVKKFNKILLLSLSGLFVLGTVMMLIFRNH